MSSAGTPADESATRSLRPAEALPSGAATAPHPLPVTVEPAAVTRAILEASPEPSVAELPLPPLRPAAWVAPLPPALRDPSFAPEIAREGPPPPAAPESFVSPPLPAPTRDHALEARFSRLEARLDALVQWVDAVAEFQGRRQTAATPAPALERRVLLVLIMVGAFVPVLGLLVALARLWS